MDIQHLQMFSPAVDKSKSSYTLLEMSNFYDLEIRGIFGVPN
jgi:hypothetical protein